ncbi:hypothetical protein HD554DRAFT_2012754, partial [Boletus coccyginus]
AAVLVLLYEKEGEPRVLLTTRSKLLRTHPGQTALPTILCTLKLGPSERWIMSSITRWQPFSTRPYPKRSPWYREGVKTDHIQRSSTRVPFLSSAKMRLFNTL